MAIYSRGDTGSTLPATQESTPIASRDLGTIIVKSMETIAESLADDDVPVHYKDIEKAVTVGVNKSDLVKKGMKGGEVASGGKADAALAAKYEQEKYIKWQEYQRKLQRQDELDRQRKKAQEERDWKETQAKVQAGFNSVVTSLDNPLKTMSNFIDKTVKDFSSGFLKGFKDARTGNKENNSNGTQGTVSSSPEVATINTQLTELAELIEDNFDEIKPAQQQTVENLEDLVTDNKDDNNDNGNKDNKQEKDKREAEKADEKKDRDKQLNATQSIGYVVGTIVGKFAGLAALLGSVVVIGSQIWMWLKGKLYTWLAEMPVKRDIAIAEIRSNVETIPKKLQLAGERIMSQIHFPGFSFGGISSEEKDELKGLKKDKELSQYRTALEMAQQKGDKELFSLAGAESLKKKDYDLSTDERVEKYRQDYLAAIRKKYKGESEEDLNSRLLAANTAFDAKLDIKRGYENKARETLTNASPELIAKAERYEDLLARSKKSPMSDAEYERRGKALELEQENRKLELVGESISKRVSKGTLTEFQAETFEKEGYKGTVDNVLQQYQDNTGKKFTFAQSTPQERWINEKFEPWKQGYKDWGHDMQLDLNIDTTHNKDNPLNSNSSNR